MSHMEQADWEDRMNSSASGVAPPLDVFGAPQAEPQPRSAQVVTRDKMADVMLKQFDECMYLRGEGQKEYARRDDNAFANFERVAEGLGITREKALMVYAMKHWDGVLSYIEGHKSQREDVRGRIGDLITYLCLLRGMIDQNDNLLPQNYEPARLRSAIVDSAIESEAADDE